VAGRWLPESEGDLRAALVSGVLSEGHFFDAKQELAPMAKGSRRLAEDVASFAVDGGLIVAGVAEDKATGNFELRPVPLAGLAERVDQIARSVVDPPLQVWCVDVPAEVGGGLGYLLITVPASALAPHMVDGKYRGRHHERRPDRRGGAPAARAGDAEQ
jgi:hypothetical protein